MATPTLDRAFNGQPFVQVSKTTAAGTLDRGFNAQPFYVKPTAAAVPAAQARPIMFIVM